MPQSMLDIALETIREHRMIAPGQRVAVACSGGADSTALLFLLRELAEPLGCVLSVAHLNHCLRGAESDADELFVQQLAQRLDLPFHGERVDVGQLARSARANQEAVARRVRFNFFRSLTGHASGSSGPGKVDRVALAHTADDQAETVLHRLIRGAGTRGLSGIYPQVEGGIIRPLLAVRRAALREWLAAKGERWREDSSNTDLRFTRNRLRREVLPLLARFNPRVVETLADTAVLAQAEEAFWEEYLKHFCETAVSLERGRAVLDLTELKNAPEAAAFRVIRWVTAQVGSGGAMDLAHVRGLLRWALRGQSGHRFVLPRGLEARREFAHLILESVDSREAATTSKAGDYEYQVAVPGAVAVAELGLTFQFDLVPGGEGEAYNRHEGVLMDGRLAQEPLCLRNWRAGDAYQPVGRRKVRKLQDLFQQQRVPLRKRSGWPVLVAGNQIVWARGMAVAAGFGASPKSVQLLAIREVPSE